MSAWHSCGAISAYASGWKEDLARQLEGVLDRLCSMANALGANVVICLEVDIYPWETTPGPGGNRIHASGSAMYMVPTGDLLRSARHVPEPIWTSDPTR